jgi:hypothetical protein
MEEIEERKFNRLLKVSFSPPEKIEMSEQIANAIRNLKKAQDDLASVAAQFKSEIKKFEGEIASLAEKVNSGWEMRNIPCREVKDFSVGAVLVFRDDTQELIEERAMTAEERQPELPLKEKEPEPPATDLGEDRAVPGQPDLSSQPEAPLDLPEDTNPFYVGKKEGSDV